MTARQDIIAMMSELGVEPKKSLGQNFLVSDHVIQKIIDCVKRFQPESIIEVGPGLGSLTKHLKGLNENLLLIELDQNFAGYWRKNGFRVVEEDALQWNWKTHKLAPPVCLVSNLPYQISSSLVIDRCLDEAQLDVMVLMFQKEVAQRLKAQEKTSNFGMLSVIAQTFWEISTLLEASSGDFMPPPKVASRVLTFKKKESSIQNRGAFLKFLKACFVQPRKLLISNLSGSLPPQMKVPKEQLAKIFSELGLVDKVRAQQLTCAEFKKLYFKLGFE